MLDMEKSNCKNCQCDKEEPEFHSHTKLVISIDIWPVLIILFVIGLINIPIFVS